MAGLRAYKRISPRLTPSHAVAQWLWRT